MQNRRLVAVALFALAPRPAAAQSVVPISAFRAQRIAVGVLPASQYTAPITVEASLDGWVYLAALNGRREGSAFPTSNQLIVEARDVRAWATAARAALTQPPGESSTHLAPLGRGSDNLDVGLGSTKYPSVYVTLGCRKSRGSSTMPREDLAKLVNLLDSAATIAGLGESRAPTLARPYYTNEVSCAATPAADNALPIAPPTYRGALPEVGAGFIVDTAGRVEPGSIRILDGTDASIARAVRLAIAGWRFDPADWNGTPLRQFVQTAVSFVKEPPAPTMLVGGKATLALKPTDDGFVRLDVLDLWGRPLHEWFKPSELDAWAKRLDTRAMRDSAVRSRYGTSWENLGADSGFVLTGAWKRIEKTDSVAFRISLHGCDLDQMSGGPVDPAPPLSAFRAASAAARKRRATPKFDLTAAHESSEVSCPARFYWQPVTARIARGGWMYPLGAYSPEMAASNARIEVLVSFVLDTLGRADARTLRIMADADPRAISRIRQSIDGLHFRAAIRDARHVAQRVIYLVRFEAPPVCRDELNGPLCARDYSDR